MDSNIKEARIKYSRLIKQSQEKANKGYCLWCGQKIVGGFCNSHSVPLCVLKNIAVDGKVQNFNSMVEIPLIDSDEGIKKAGTFKLLCKNCDGTIFQDYENLEALGQIPTETMLEEIALKNILMVINKRSIEIPLYDNLQKEFGDNYPYDKKQQANTLDQRDFWIDFTRIKEMRLSTDSYDKFKLFYWRKLDYVIPMAFQGMAALYGDLEGEMITDIYNNSEDIVIKHIHLCAFPLKTESVVFAFYHEDDTEYDKFANQFKALDEDSKLDLINFMIFGYCEDMIFASKFPHHIWVLDQLRTVFFEDSTILALNEVDLNAQKRNQLLICNDRCQG